MNDRHDSAKPQGNSCAGGNCGCGGLDRRDFLKFMGVSAAGALLAAAPGQVMAGPFEPSDLEKMVPADKKLHPDWVKSLYARGKKSVYRGKDLARIGMPVGGMCAGQVYLGGDGRLWHWDIFNKQVRTNDKTYAAPPDPDFPISQGFALKVVQGDKVVARTLDIKGFPGVTFCGEYPIGNVAYKDKEVPVEVALEAFSPFIPLEVEMSSLPATVMRYTVKNTSAAPVEAELAGWLQNPVCLYTGQPGEGELINTVRREEGLTILECTGKGQDPEKKNVVRAPQVFADFEAQDYGNWTVEGEAFGKGPSQGSRGGQSLFGYQGKGLVNTWTGTDKLEGRLRSPEFKIERPFINFMIGGGNHPGETCINLVVDNKPVRSETGSNTDAMRWVSWNVRDLAGKTARFGIVDRATGAWGHIAIDQIVFADEPADQVPFTWRSDYGSMALAALETRNAERGVRNATTAAAKLGKETPGEAVFETPAADARATGPMEQILIGKVGRKIRLAPGASETITFLIAWNFPNWNLRGLKDVGGRYYATRFKNAAEAARHLAENFDELYAQTRLWRDTWYDSTLPRWLLDRLFVPASTMATSTCYRLASGRFWAWEGVGCCHGTCGHVWQYAHSMARLFPALERDTRERVDFGMSFQESGAIFFRGEFNQEMAVDAQTGTILRVYREHQMSPDDGFLRRIWPRVRKGFEPLFALDPDRDGILEGAQMNTLDRAWFGKIAWLSSMYVAALRAGEAMAVEMGDEEFASTCREIAERGARNIDKTLFNGEYYYQIADPDRLKEVGSFDGCEVDQVMGESWARQVGLRTGLSAKNVKKALQSLWKYNFAPDAGGLFREKHKEGRWYAMAGEAGLLMCSWPRGEGKRATGRFDYYFNEVWTGTEYQAASHMMWEGMAQEALAICRAAHDRHHPGRRNPYNEIECGEHYARAMASHGVYLATCGYEYHGPAGRLAFAPRVGAEDFRAAFTAAEGWGTYAQKIEGAKMSASIEVKRGTLRLNELALALPKGARAKAVSVKNGGEVIEARPTVKDGRITIALPGTVLTSDRALEITIA